MSTPDRALLVGTLLLAALPSFAAESPQLGTPITSAEMAAWDLSIQPDGRGLPPGSGNAATGKAVFAEKCVACHNEEGKGQPFDRLVGGQGTLASAAPVKTIGSYWPYASTVFDYIRRAMPLVAPQSLTNDEVYSLTAYLLSLNGIIKERDVMNAKTLAKVKMPNQGGFIIKYPEK
jgi:cytochrome c